VGKIYPLGLILVRKIAFYFWLAEPTSSDKWPNVSAVNGTKTPPFESCDLTKVNELMFVLFRWREDGLL